MSKLIAWGMVLLVVTLVFHQQAALLFLDDFFDHSLSSQVEDQSSGLGLKRFPHEVPSLPNLLADRGPSFVLDSSEAGRADVLRPAMSDKTLIAHVENGPPIAHYETARPAYAGRWEAKAPARFYETGLNTPLSTLHAPMVSLPGATFQMGDSLAEESDQRPRHLVRVSPFRMDRYEVTNCQFELFVRATGYQTTAERQGWSYVFDFQQKSWVRMVGACWWNTTGKTSERPAIETIADFPVVHVSWEDAQSFCQWAGKRLPTEAEREYVAKGKLLDAKYPWGDARTKNGREQANYWQGWFPNENVQKDGFLLLAPVGSFPANAYGLHDIAGNVWEWCADRYAPDYYQRSPTDNPLGPAPEDAHRETLSKMVLRQENGRYIEERFEGIEEVFLRVIRGGSFLSSENTDAGYRVRARSSRPQTLSFQDVGFRCVE